MNHTKPFRDMKRAKYTAELAANARMLPDSYDGDWLDMLIAARNALLLCPAKPGFASQIFERDGTNEHSQTMRWTVCRSTDQRASLPTLAELDMCTEPSPRHWVVRRPHRHATDLENRLRPLPWFLRSQAV